MNLKKFSRSALPVVALALASFSAQAATINTLFGPGINNVQDQDVERVMRDTDNDGVVDTHITAGDVQVGDVIQTILRWDTVNSNTISDALPAPYQFLAYSELKIDSLTDIGGGLFDYTFTATGSANMQNAMSLVDFYEGTPGLGLGYNSGIDAATGISQVLAQTYLASAGFQEAFDFWTAVAPTDITALSGAPQGSAQAGQGVLGLSLLANPGNLPVANLGIVSPISGLNHDFVGNTGVYAADIGVNPDWNFSSNSTFAFATQQVPAPATLALFGLGFAGLGVKLRRKST